MRACRKCGGTDIRVTYVAAGTVLGYWEIDMFLQMDRADEYIDSLSMKVRKEFLSCFCRTCQYKWIEDTLDNTNVKRKVSNVEKATF